MKRRYFGTDGVRGKVGSAPITPDFVMKLGQAAGRVLKRHNPTGRASVLIGKDTRVSGYMLEAALQAGFSSAGVDVVLCGPIPTPAVAYLTRAQRLDAGVVISASHNPMTTTALNFSLPPDRSSRTAGKWRLKKRLTKASPAFRRQSWERLDGSMMPLDATSNSANRRSTATSI